MSGSKKTVAVIFGGVSPEHDVSIVTGLQAMGALDPALFEAFPVYIARNGEWWVGDPLSERGFYIPDLEAAKGVSRVSLTMSALGRPHLTAEASGFLARERKIEFDVALLALHGLTGENGALQGWLEMTGVPYTGMGHLASAVLMDKVATKRMFEGADIPMLPYRLFHRPAKGLALSDDAFAAAAEGVSYPVCVKPVNLGSSIGVGRADTAAEAADLLPGVFKFDTTAIAEPFVPNLVEYNLAVARIGGQIRTSAIERPKHSSELLDFKAKYMSGGGTKGKSGSKQPGTASEGMLSLTREINPELPGDLEARIRGWAIETFERIGGTGAPRLDFMCDSETGEAWLNEVNPIPGSFGYFLWEGAEQPMLFASLLEHLIDEAFARRAAARLPADPTPSDARLFKRPS